jgi:hypothetical protein
MRLMSTHESIEKEELSALALVETVIAISIGVAVCILIRSIRPISIAAVLAPFLLLRTTDSVENGLLWTRRVGVKIVNVMHLIVDRLDVLDSRGGHLYNIVMIVADYIASFFLLLIFITSLVITATCIKIFVTVIHLVSHPIRAMSVIPANWRKITLCTDVGTLPEVVPGVEGASRSGPFAYLRISNMMRVLGSINEDPFTTKTNLWLFSLALLAILYVVATAYRFSLKATALIWTPLLWIVGPMSQAMDLPTFLHNVTTLTLYKLARIYSLFVLGLLSVKFFLLLSLSQFGHILEALPAWYALKHYIVPDAVPAWHIAAGANAVLAWIMLFQAELVVARLDDPARVRALQTRFIGFLVIRNALTFYVILCNLYITVQIATSIGLPRIVLFPSI